MTGTSSGRETSANQAFTTERPVVPKVWVLTDGKIGDDVQCLAVANALDPEFEKRVVSPGQLWAWAAPWGPVDPAERPGVEGGPLTGAPPDIVITSGRRAIPYARLLKQKSGGRTKIVILKDPRFRREVADVIWVPAHDDIVRGSKIPANIFSTLTSPHGLRGKVNGTPQPAHKDIASLPQSFLGVVLGGPSGGALYNAEAAKKLASAVSNATKDYAGLAVTPSRRTPVEFMDVFSKAIDHDNFYIWDGAGENPYIDILSCADALIVAGDSHNMMSEALCARAGVYVWRPNGLSGKMCWFLDQLEARGDVRGFSDTARSFDRIQKDATDEIVAEIKARLSL